MERAIRKNNAAKQRRMDAESDTTSEPAAWITTKNGHHVPLDENGTAMAGGGGELTGKNFSNAQSTNTSSGNNSGGSSSSSSSKSSNSSKSSSSSKLPSSGSIAKASAARDKANAKNPAVKELNRILDNPDGLEEGVNGEYDRAISKAAAEASKQIGNYDSLVCTSFNDDGTKTEVVYTKLPYNAKRDGSGVSYDQTVRYLDENGNVTREKHWGNIRGTDNYYSHPNNVFSVRKYGETEVDEDQIGANLAPAKKVSQEVSDAREKASKENEAVRALNRIASSADCVDAHHSDYEKAMEEAGQHAGVNIDVGDSIVMTTTTETETGKYTVEHIYTKMAPKPNEDNGRVAFKSSTRWYDQNGKLVANDRYKYRVYDAGVPSEYQSQSAVFSVRKKKAKK